VLNAPSVQGSRGLRLPRSLNRHVARLWLIVSHGAPLLVHASYLTLYPPLYATPSQLFVMLKVLKLPSDSQYVYQVCTTNVVFVFTFCTEARPNLVSANFNRFVSDCNDLPADPTRPAMPSTLFVHAAHKLFLYRRSLSCPMSSQRYSAAPRLTRVTSWYGSALPCALHLRPSRGLGLTLPRSFPLAIPKS
jgi:hypothetical protein